MPFTRSGKHYTMRAKRACPTCGLMTWHSCSSIRYSQPEEPTVPESLNKRMEWICETCTKVEEEIKQVYVPTDKTRIVNRLLRLGDDYDLRSVKIESSPDEIILRVKLPDFDMSELRSVQYKQQETGFITAEELMLLQKAGFRRSSDVPPKPQPKDRRILRERARQKMFQGEPRSM